MREGGKCSVGRVSVVWWVVLLGVVFSISISFVCLRYILIVCVITKV